MSADRDAAASARWRRAASSVAVVVVLAAVWLVSTLTEPSTPEATRPTATFSPPAGGVDTSSFRGRLVFAANAPDGRPDLRQRLYVLDLATATIAAGPRIPTATELFSVADGSIVIVSEGPDGRRTAALVATLDAQAPARTFAHGSFVASSASARVVQVTELVDQPRCDGGAGYVVREFRFVLGAPSPWRSRDPVRCGTPIAVAAEDGSTAASVLDEDGELFVEVDGIPVTPPLRDVAILGIGPSRTVLFAGLEPPVTAATPPVGPLLAWQFAGGTRPAVDGLVATRFLRWSPDGIRAVVNGALDGRRAMWLIDPARGSATAILPSNDVELGTWFSGATFDDAGNVFGAGAGVIVASTNAGTFPLELPADAPVPAGPIVWLP